MVFMTKEQKQEINYEDFEKIDIRIGEIKNAEMVEGADKLIKCTVDFGEGLGERTIVSGIKEWFTPEALIGKKLPYVINLAPRKLKGVVSEGMLLAGSYEKDDDKELVLLEVDGDVAPGAIVG